MTEPNPSNPSNPNSPVPPVPPAPIVVEEEELEESFEEIIERVLDTRLKRRLKIAGDFAKGFALVAGIAVVLGLGARFSYLAGQRDVHHSAEYRWGRTLDSYANTPDRIYCLVRFPDGYPQAWPSTSKGSCKQEAASSSVAVVSSFAFAGVSKTCGYDGTKYYSSDGATCIPDISIQPSGR